MSRAKVLLLVSALAVAVAACGGGGGGESGSSASASPGLSQADTTPPSTPAGLVAAAAGGSVVDLAWNASTDNVGVTGYVVRRNGVEVGSATTTSFADTGLSGVTTYSYTVAAHDAAGNVSSESTSVDATTADAIAPTTPAALVAIASGATTVNLTWNASTDNVGVTGYIVKRNGTQVGTPLGAAYADTGLTSATTYNYTVAARDAANNVSTESTSVSATTGSPADTSPPSVPTGLVATAAGATVVHLAWNASTDNVGVTDYIVSRNGIPLGSPITTTSYSDTGLSGATTYSYTVAARDTAGNVSANSTGASVTTADTIPPSTPTALSATAAGAAAVHLAWNASTDNVGIAGYIVSRNGVPLPNLITATSYSDTGLSSATTYSYTVTARDTAGNVSASSASASATTVDTIAPSTPTGLNATAAGATAVNLAWNASTDNVGVTGYVVSRNGVPLGSPITTTSYSDTGLSGATMYNYTVAARDAAGNVSANSAVVSATTADATPPSTPTSVVAIAAGATAINLSWTASTDNVGVTGYIVKRDGNQVGTPASPAFADTGLLSGLTYSYTVTARDAAGNLSPVSASVDATTADSVAPSIPASLNAIAASATVVNLAWSASTDNVGVSGYIVSRNGVPLGIPITTTSYSDTGLSGATTYSYTVAARDAAGNVSANSAVASATTPDATPPSAPTGLVAMAAGSAAITLTWTASTDNVGVTGYIVKRNGTQVGPPTTTPGYTDTGLTAATSYTYAVAARDAAGNVSSESASASATTTSAADTTPPSTPGGLVATIAGATIINLSWASSTDNVGVTGYIVSRNGVQLATPATSSYSDTGLTAGTTYTYAVAARDAAGNISANSTSASASIPDTTAPSTPTGVTAIAAGATTINLVWNASTDNVGVTGYIVKRNGAQVGTPSTTSFADTGLLSGSTQSYTVVARDSAGNFSPESASVDATTADTIAPSTPAGLVATAAGASTINLTWSASTDNVGVSGYIVRRNGVQVGTPLAPSYSDTGLSGATTYNYTVLARDAANNVSPESAIVSATTADATLPSAPSGLVATAAGATTINLTWSASTDNVGVAGYIVKRNGAQVATSSATSYADSGLSSGTTYSYTVSARDAAGNFSPDSASASATTVDTIAPSAPASLVATAAVGAAAISLTWSASTDNVGVTAYIVKRDGVQVATPGTTSYTDAGLSSATTYSYTVAARDAAVNISPESASVSATTADTTSPSTPTGLVATAAGSAATINLSWGASTDNVGVTEYLVKRNGVQLAILSATNYSDVGLSVATTYSYTISARDAAGNVSSESASVSATTAGVLFPLVISGNQRYLRDQNNVPFPILGRTAWFLTSLPVADYKMFIDDSVAKGYNAVEFHVINHDARGNNPPFGNNPLIGNGDLPFLLRLNGSGWNGSLSYTNINNDAPDFTTLNEAYWTHVDSILAYAEFKGVLCFMFPAYVGFDGTGQGWMEEIVANNFGPPPTKIQTYGAWIANRYKNQKNIVWMAGGDSMFAVQSQVDAENSLITGLKSVPNQQSIYFSAEWTRGSVATDQPDFGSQMTLNGTYSNSSDINNQGNRAYLRVPTIPAFLLEQPYDEEGADGNGVNGDATQPVRRFQWWGMLSNIGGHISGNGYVWPFNSGWQGHLNTQGAQDMARLNAFVRSIAWYNLVPSGLNGMRQLVTAGGGSSVTSSNYVAAAATPDGTLLVAYVPPDHFGPITIDMTAMSGPAQARWFNPTSAAYTLIGTFPNVGTQVFTVPPGGNGTAFPDWVLLLEKQ